MLPGGSVLRPGSLLIATALLGGCFLADGDELDPIIPDAALTYPMKPGPARQCTEQTDGEPTCARALLEKRLGGGYSLSVWEKKEDGTEEKGSPKQYRVRKLVGPAVPKAAFLVQIIDDNPDGRFLGLLRQRADGGWEQLEPQCDQLPAPRFAEFITGGWLLTDPQATLDDITCRVARDGLTDERLHAILDAPKKSSITVLYPRK